MHTLLLTLTLQLLLGQQVLADTAKPDYHEFATMVADIDGIPPAEFAAVVECESQFQNDAVGDSGTSIGIAQIHLPAHPDITKEQARDPYFSLSWMGSEWLDGRAWEWSCWKKLHNQWI